MFHIVEASGPTERGVVGEGWSEAPGLRRMRPFVSTDVNWKAGAG